VAHCPNTGVKVKVLVPGVDVLIEAGFQVPVIPFMDVTGNTGAVLFRQNGPITVKVGMTAALIFIDNVVANAF